MRVGSYSRAKKSRFSAPVAKVGLAYYHSSKGLEDRPSAAFFGRLARGHWGGCEIRNHWVRDSQMIEDRTRISDYNINANLTTLRC